MKGSVSTAYEGTTFPMARKLFKIKYAKHTGFECQVWNIREHGVLLDWNITYIAIMYMIHLAEINVKEQISCSLI